MVSDIGDGVLITVLEDSGVTTEVLVGIGVGVDEGVETTVAAGWPIGTIPTSSGRSEGETGGRVSTEESGVAVRGGTFSELVWADTGKLNISVINKKHPEKGRLFL